MDSVVRSAALSSLATCQDIASALTIASFLLACGSERSICVAIGGLLARCPMTRAFCFGRYKKNNHYDSRIGVYIRGIARGVHM